MALAAARQPLDLSSLRAGLSELAWPTATQAQLKARSLQRRFDAKVILAADQLLPLLGQTANRHAIVDGGNGPIATYRNLYFDTPDGGCIDDHRRGRRARYKIRLHHYPDRQFSTLEIKAKAADEQTRKARRPVPFGQETLSLEDRRFIAKNCPIDPETLVPSLRIDFQRLTIIGLDEPERATFDVNLSFRRGDDQVALPWLVIGELKQARFRARSPMMLALRRAGLRPLPMSKAMTGAGLLDPTVKTQRFRPTLRAVERTAHG